MAAPKFEFRETRSGDVATDVLIVKFEIPGGVTTPDEAAFATHTVEGQLSGTRPVLLNGRGPVWLYGMLMHAAHPTPMVGVYDPRLAGYVVVESHDKRFILGQVIPDPET